MPWKNFRFSNNGFSLIELLIAIAIVALVTAIAIPNLKQFNKSQEIEGAALQLFNTIRTAQSSAAAHIKCPTGQTSTKWQVDLNLSGSSDTYSLIANCQTAPTQETMETIMSTPFAPTPKSLATFQAITDICGISTNVSLFFTNQQFTFSCNGGPVQTSALEITLRNGANCNSPNLCKSVVIESGGVIRIN